MTPTMKIKNHSGCEIAVAKKSLPHEGLVRGESVHEKQIEGRHGDDRFDPDLTGPKPVELLAAIEQNLHGADGQTQGAEAEQVQLCTGIPVGVGQESANAEEGKGSDRQVDVEHPAPGVILGQPAAEHRAQNGADHDRDAKQRHRGSPALRRIDVDQYRLREWDERRTEHALQGPEQHDLHQGLRHPAQHRRDGKSGDGNEENPLAPEPAGKESGRRDHDSGRDDIRGQHPVDLILAGGDATLNVRQRNVGDRRVEGLHDGSEDHAYGDRRPIRTFC